MCPGATATTTFALSLAKLAVRSAVGHVSEIEWFSDKQRYALREHLAQLREKSGMVTRLGGLEPGNRA